MLPLFDSILKAGRILWQVQSGVMESGRFRKRHKIFLFVGANCQYDYTGIRYLVERICIVLFFFAPGYP